jgi:hypothetical protein
MMKTRLQAEAVIDTQAHAETMRDWITSALSGLDIFELHRNEVTTDEETGDILLLVDIRFNDEAERDLVRDNAHGQAQGGWASWILELRLHWHDCRHDEATTHSCQDPNFSRYQVWHPGDPWPAL